MLGPCGTKHGTPDLCSFNTAGWPQVTDSSFFLFTAEEPSGRLEMDRLDWRDRRG